MTKEKFKELAEKHLFILEGYTMDEEGNKEMQIFGFDKLYEALNMHGVRSSKRVSNFELFEEINSDFLQAMIDNDQGIYDPVEEFKEQLEDKYIIIKKQLITA